MIIETAQTPDENVMNFFPSCPITKNKHAEFVDAKSLRKSPLAEKIFDLGQIVSLFISEDMVAVTKAKDALWDNLKPQILAELMEYLTTGEEVIIENANSPEDVCKNIEALINSRIRPAIKKDGGDIVFKKFEDGIVYVELQGSCVGCPYAMVTLKEGVEKVLKDYIVGIKAVQSVNKEQNA